MLKLNGLALDLVNHLYRGPSQRVLFRIKKAIPMRYVNIKLHGEILSAESKQRLMLDIQSALVAATGNADVPACISIDEVAAANWGLLGLSEEHKDTEGKADHVVVNPEPELVKLGTFVHRADFDDNGIVAHLAGRPKQIYRNPADAGLLGVSSSPLLEDSAPASAIVGNQVVRCCTKPALNSWFEIDFKQHRVAPSHYSLRHYSSWDTEALRHWTLEGSVDGAQWHLLSTHENDKALAAKGATCTWRLNGLWPSMFFRFLRITQRGPNSNQHNYLALSGFEVYGQFAKAGGAQPSLRVLNQYSKVMLNPALVSRLRDNMVLPMPVSSERSIAGVQSNTWDPNRMDSLLHLDERTGVVSNRGSGDKWQSAMSVRSFSKGVCRVMVEIVAASSTANNWAFVVGLVPPSFPLTTVGLSNSWGYIGGTGGKCFNVSTSTPYGPTYGKKGDRITMIINLDKGTLSYELNGVNLGVAFANVVGPVHVAVSMTAAEAAVRLLIES